MIAFYIIKEKRFKRELSRGFPQRDLSEILFKRIKFPFKKVTLKNDPVEYDSKKSLNFTLKR